MVHCKSRKMQNLKDAMVSTTFCFDARKETDSSNISCVLSFVGFYSLRYNNIGLFSKTSQDVRKSVKTKKRCTHVFSVNKKNPYSTIEQIRGEDHCSWKRCVSLPFKLLGAVTLPTGISSRVSQTNYTNFSVTHTNYFLSQYHKKNNCR